MFCILLKGVAHVQRKCKGLALYKNAHFYIVLLKQSINPAILTSKCAQIECMNQDVLQILGCEGRCVYLLACKLSEAVLVVGVTF